MKKIQCRLFQEKMAPNSSWWSFFVACFVIAVASELDFAANNAG